ncbi:MAG: FHA domain-containing protein [Clostridia bacterium]|nr:FHA domain-containing protein [Clostridia bacterium]
MFISKSSEGNRVILKLPIEEEYFLSFEGQMILKSDQKYFVDVFLEDQLIWDITGLMTVDKYISVIEADSQQIKIFIQNFIEGILSAKDYFLEENSIILDSDYIFYDSHTESIKLVYAPLLNQPSQNMHHQFKKVVLSWLYRLDLKRNRNDELRDLITFIQSESTDMIQIKNYLNEPYKRKRKKTSFKSKTIKGVSDVNRDETVCLKASVPYLLLKHKKVYLDKALFRIGRGYENDLVLDKEPSVGRVHCEIVHEDETFFLLDCNSTNGTYLNGNLLLRGEKYKLSNQDLIQFANVKAIYKSN